MKLKRIYEIGYRFVYVNKMVSSDTEKTSDGSSSLLGMIPEIFTVVRHQGEEYFRLCRGNTEYDFEGG